LGGLHLLLGDVLEDHVDVDVEPAEGADELLVSLHDHPNLGSDAPVDQLCSSRQFAQARARAWRHAHRKEAEPVSQELETSRLDDGAIQLGESKEALREKAMLFRAPDGRSWEGLF
jgi:hypothetical protein